MKRSLLFIVGIIALHGLFTTVTVLGQEKEQATSHFTDLTFKVAPVGSTFLPMEPIPLDISLSNNTKLPIIGRPDIRFNGLLINLVVTNEKGVTITIPNIDTGRDHIRPFENKLIEPEASFRSREIFYNLHSIFPDIGLYKVQATFQDATRQHQIKSDVVTVRIVEPKGRELEAYNAIRPLNKSGWFFAGSFTTDEKFAKAEDIAIQFPDTRYGEYVGYVVGNTYKVVGDLVRARQMLERLSLKTDFIFSEAAKEVLAEINQQEQKN